jgi:peptidoglycan/xylan/chitin deacetylase (PgdA/CDA1 family)
MRNRNIRLVYGFILVAAIAYLSFHIFWMYPRYTVPILTYHSISYDKSLLSVTPENFEKQMCYLKKNNYKVILLDKLVDGIINKKEFPHKTLVITFDDGYKDNFTYAYPILNRYGFPATIFLASNDIGVNENFLNWAEIKKKSNNNITFWGHTRSHIYLPSLSGSKDKLWDEIYGCKLDIEKNIGIEVKHFCYPSGGFSDEIKEYIRRAGYKGAVATNRGNSLRDITDVYEINRVSVRNEGFVSFKVKASGYYNLFRSKKKPC